MRFNGPKRSRKMRISVFKDLLESTKMDDVLYFSEAGGWGGLFFTQKMFQIHLLQLYVVHLYSPSPSLGTRRRKWWLSFLCGAGGGSVPSLTTTPPPTPPPASSCGGLPVCVTQRFGPKPGSQPDSYDALKDGPDGPSGLWNAVLVLRTLFSCLSSSEC